MLMYYWPRYCSRAHELYVIYTTDWHDLLAPCICVCITVLQGRLVEAIEVALESKDLGQVDHVLSTVVPADIRTHISKNSDEHSTLLLLCLIQQLAADLFNNPAYCVASTGTGTGAPTVGSRMEWLKSLIMFVIMELEVSKNDVVETVLSAVLSDFKAIQQKLLIVKTNDSVSGIGVESGGRILIKSSSIQSDVKMLIYIIHSYLTDNE